MEGPTAEAFDRIKETFRRADSNGDGFIAKDELRRLFGVIGAWTDAEFDELYRDADKSGDGKLNYEEFLSWVLSQDDTDDSGKKGMLVPEIVDELMGPVSPQAPQNTAASAPEWRRLFGHMQPLARGTLFAVSQSLAVLQEAGITEIANLREARAAADAALFVADETDYRLLCSWCRTPRLWREAALAAGAARRCRLEGLAAGERGQLREVARSEEESAREAAKGSPACAEGAPGAEELERKMKLAKRSKLRRTLRQREQEGKVGKSFGFLEHFKEWWGAMLDADLEIRTLVVDGYNPETLGEGLGAIFETVDNFKSLPNKSSGPKGRVRLQPDVGSIALFAMGMAVEAKEKPTFARTYGHTVWFSTVPFKEWPVPAAKHEHAEVVEVVKAEVVRGRPLAAVVTLHLGGWGCGAGVAAWQQLFQEHGLGADGRPQGGEALLGGSPAHFAESRTGRYVPRAVFADTDAEGLAGARSAKCFSPADIADPAADLQSKWGFLADGGGTLCKSIMEIVRCHMERTDNPRCFMLTHSLHGFAGGAIASAVTHQLREEYRKHFVWNLALAPDPSPELSARDSYNTVLSLCQLRSGSSLLTLVDRQGLRQLATSKPLGLGLASPSSTDCDGLVARVLCAVTGPMRVGSRVNASDGWRDLLPWSLGTNLVPYPFMTTTFAAISTPGLDDAEGKDFRMGSKEDMVLQCLLHGSMLSLDTAKGRHVSSGIWCRGLAPLYAVEAARLLKTRADFRCVDWAPSAFAIGCQEAPPSGPEVVALCHNTAIYTGYGSSWGDSFDLHYQASADIHPYFECGVDNGTFVNAREELASFARDAGETERETMEGGDVDDE